MVSTLIMSYNVTRREYDGRHCEQCFYVQFVNITLDVVFLSGTNKLH